MGADGKAKAVAALGMQASFEIELLLKGNWPMNRLEFYYLREARPPAQPVPGGPQLVSFDPKKKLRYLMFLKLAKDGRFESVTGQTDPGLAIKEVAPIPEPPRGWKRSGPAGTRTPNQRLKRPLLYH